MTEYIYNSYRDVVIEKFNDTQSVFKVIYFLFFWNSFSTKKVYFQFWKNRTIANAQSVSITTRKPHQDDLFAYTMTMIMVNLHGIDRCEHLVRRTVRYFLVGRNYLFSNSCRPVSRGRWLKEKTRLWKLFAIKSPVHSLLTNAIDAFFYIPTKQWFPKIFSHGSLFKTIDFSEVPRNIQFNPLSTTRVRKYE